MAKGHMMFFATANDIAPVLSAIEAARSLQYTRTGLFDSDKLQTYFSHTDIPDLGLANHPSAVANRCYLVSASGTQIHIRPVPQDSGGTLFAVDQFINPNTIALCPAGRFGADVLLYGKVTTVSETTASKDLYVFVTKAFRKAFKRQEEFLLGPEARELWKAGVRLTMAVQTPIQYDLKRET